MTMAWPERIAIAMGALATAWALILALPALFSGYSYWFDELYSVAIATLPFKDSSLIVWNDVHPPLYQALLWSFVRVFGDGEIATRGLSFGLVLAGLAILARLPVSWGFRALLIGYLATNPLVMTYAQEVRSYALLFALSCAAVWAVMTWRPGAMLVVAVALGLTHYFGTALGGLICLMVLVQAPPHRALALCAGLVLCLWPGLQLALSATGGLTGGNFWIGTPPTEALCLAAQVSLPGLGNWRVEDGILPCPSLVGLGLPLMVLVLPVFHNRSMRSLEGLRGIAALATGLLLAVYAISWHTPIATDRNWILLLPLFGAALAGLLTQVGLAPRPSGQSGPNSMTLAMLLVGFEMVTGGISLSKEALATKSAPRQNWRALGTAIAAHPEAGPLYHVDTLHGFERAWRDHVFDHYLPEGLHSTPIALTGLGGLVPPYRLAFGHEPCWQGETRVSRELTRLGLSAELFLPEQAETCSTGLFLVQGPD